VTLRRGGPKANDAPRFARLGCYFFDSKHPDRTHSHNCLDVFQHSFKTAGVTFADRVYQTNGRVKHAEIDVETDTNGRRIEDVYMGMGRWGNGFDPHNQNPDAQP
jgi:hypothetical protein